MKFLVKDKSGKIHRISDMTDEPMPKKQGACKDAEELSADDIKALKKFVPHIDEFLALLDVEKEEHDDDFEEKEEITEEDFETEGELTEDDGDEVVEDDEVKETEEVEETEKIHDSKKPSIKKAFGSIERKKIDDSIDSEITKDEEIAQMWAKRYGGN